MSHQATAQSISRPIRERLYEGKVAGQVMGTFEQACDLLISKHDIVALVTPQIGNGPLNVVVKGLPSVIEGMEPGTPVTLTVERIQVGKFGIALDQATTWEPRPDWALLRSRRITALARLPALRSFCLEHGPSDSLLTILEPMPETAPWGVAQATLRQVADALRAGWADDLSQLQKGAKRLAGLGAGLTPSGDDFLIGAMLWAWLAHATPDPFCATIAETATDLTTTLSAAFLRAAARSECSEVWHVLLKALTQGGGKEVQEAASAVMAFGATSGADTLAGFLWTALPSTF